MNRAELAVLVSGLDVDIWTEGLPNGRTRFEVQAFFSSSGRGEGRALEAIREAAKRVEAAGVSVGGLGGHHPGGCLASSVRFSFVGE